LSKREHVASYAIDVQQFEGLTRISEDTQQEIAKALKDISNELQKWTMRALDVETATRMELRQEENELREHMRSRREQSRT
jgi:hypothetical protein